MTTSLLDAYDKLLIGVGRVSRFYTDEENLVVATTPQHKNEVENLLYGWRLYDAGANDSSIMLTFKRKA